MSKDRVLWEGPASAIFKGDEADIRNRTIDECIEVLSGEIKGCTLGWDLADKISEADACKLLNAQRLVDLQALRSLKDKPE